MITVHRFKLADPTTGEWSVQLTKSTEQRIAEMGGRTLLTLPNRSILP
jgi:hypothetical protein